MEKTEKRTWRWLRLVGIVLVALLVLDKVVSLATDEPETGHFRTAEGRTVYTEAYEEALRRVPMPSQTYDIVTDFGTVRVLEWTTPEVAELTPVLMAPGFRSGAPMWVENLPELIGRRPVYVVDALGDAGMSAQTVPIRDLDDQATWLSQTIAGLELPRVHLIGHSFGGSTAAALAVRHPEQVASLALFDPVFTLGYPSASVFFWSAVSQLPVPAWRTKALEEISGGVPGDPADPLVQMIDAASEHYSSDLPTPTLLTEAELRGLTVPVYLALAERSLAGKAAAENAALIPQAQVKTWPGTTHSLPMERAVETAAELLPFWAAHD